jgi:hypothetical protein
LALASEDTSHSAKRTFAPSSFASASPAALFKSAATTLPPCPARARTVPAPSPDAPPVTMNTLSLICILASERKMACAVASH